MTLYASVADFEDAGIEWKWPNFTPRELSCTCRLQRTARKRHCEGQYFHDHDFLNALQKLRNQIGKPLKINSAHRCIGRNRDVGGSRNSQHLTLAVDIDLEGHDRIDLYHRAEKLGFNGIGRYKTFIHIDRRPWVARWWGPDAKDLWV